MKKLIILIGLIIIFFIIFIIIYLIPKEYNKEYKIKDFTIIEEYHKDNKYYEFKISKDGYSYDFIIEHKYLNDRKLIKDFEIIEKENIFCILPIIKKMESYPLCYENDILVNFSLIKDNDLLNMYRLKDNNIEKKYKNITINNYFNHTYLLWNYKGFYYLNNDIQKEINLLKNDIYNIDLIATVNNYLFVPDYDQEHKFKNAYIIDMKEGTSDVWVLDYEIYFDSYIMGTLDNSIYLFDKKNNIQYELVPHKKKMRKISSGELGKIWNKNKFELTSLSKINNNNLPFIYTNNYQFIINENHLYLKTNDSILNMKISNIFDPLIVSQLNNEIFYLNNGKLYGYNPYLGEQLLMEYFEWNFNNTNMIFIY